MPVARLDDGEVENGKDVMAGRLSAVVSRLTTPQTILGDGLPLFGRICRTKTATDDADSPEEPNQFQALLKGDSSDTAAFEQVCKAARSRRLIFIGEQHHQPKVLSAQMQILQRLLKDRHTRQKKIHVVFEHWSLIDQPFLDRINRAESVEDVKEILSEAENDEGDAKTSEGFRLSHYATLIRLVRELCGNVWAGFPPRDWARIVAKGEGDVFHTVQEKDRERYETGKEQVKDEEASLIPPMPKEAYELVSNVSWAHRTYLKSMFHPDQRPLLPDQAVSGLLPPAPERSGFTPAQSLKDTFFAHSIATLLNRDPNNVVIGICGLGHCEWSFGAPERVVCDERPYIIITKPLDSAHWPANPVPLKDLQGSEGWQRKQADAVLVYEWVD